MINEQLIFDNLGNAIATINGHKVEIRELDFSYEVYIDGCFWREFNTIAKAENTTRWHLKNKTLSLC